MADVQEIATKTGLTSEQVAEIIASAGNINVTTTAGGTVTTRTVYSADRIAQRRAELAAERANLDAEVAATLRWIRSN